MIVRGWKPLSAGLMLALAAGPVGAAGIRDSANLFAPQILDEADGVIGQIKTKYQKDVHVETYNKVPAEKAAEFNKFKKDAKYRNQFLNKWANERLQATRTNGVYVLFYRENREIYGTCVLTDLKTGKQDFTPEDCVSTKDAIVARMDGLKDDEAIVDGLTNISQMFETNLKIVAPIPEAKPAGGPAFEPPPIEEPEKDFDISIYFVPGLILVGAGWVIIGLIRSFGGAGRPHYSAAGYDPSKSRQRGTFLTGLVGGMFGSKAALGFHRAFFDRPLPRANAPVAPPRVEKPTNGFAPRGSAGRASGLNRKPSGDIGGEFGENAYGRGRDL